MILHNKGGKLFLLLRTAFFMKGLRVIFQIAILFAFSMIGEVLHNICHIPIPGSIIGLILLLVCLSFKIIPMKVIENGANFLLAFLPLLFIPAMIGIMKYPSLFSKSGAILFLIVVISTIITMIAAGAASQFLEMRAKKRKEKEQCNNHLSQSL